MSVQSSLYQFAELLVKFVLSSRGKVVAFRPNNYMRVSPEIVAVIYELSARGMISKTRNSKGVRIMVSPDSPLYKLVESACGEVSTAGCVKQVAEYLGRFI